MFPRVTQVDNLMRAIYKKKKEMEHNIKWLNTESQQGLSPAFPVFPPTFTFLVFVAVYIFEGAVHPTLKYEVTAANSHKQVHEQAADMHQLQSVK